ncbi:MAG TPA: GxxExxY protein [Gemmatimonadaceae bacterium]|nr:GxxExxY protein [Gemmatimonadaceae bacterium]
MITAIRNFAQILTCEPTHTSASPRTDGEIINAFFTVYNELGFGLLESAYAAALERELTSRGLRVSREFMVGVYYKGDRVSWQRLDMVVSETILVETKSTRFLPPLTKRQVLSYLTNTTLEVGLILHFGPHAKFYRMISTNK